MVLKTRIYPGVDPVRGIVASGCFMVNGANASTDGLEGARILEVFSIRMEGYVSGFPMHIPYIHPL